MKIDVQVTVGGIGRNFGTVKEIRTKIRIETEMEIAAGTEIGTAIEIEMKTGKL